MLIGTNLTWDSSSDSGSHSLKRYRPCSPEMLPASLSYSNNLCLISKSGCVCDLVDNIQVLMAPGFLLLLSLLLEVGLEGVLESCYNASFRWYKLLLLCISDGMSEWLCIRCLRINFSPTSSFYHEATRHPWNNEVPLHCL